MSIDISDGIKSGNITLKVLTTNTVISTLLTDSKFEDKVIQPQSNGSKLLGEHGLAILLEINENGEKKTFLLDSGGPKSTVIDNGASMGVNFSEVEKIILSHGHVDHFGGFINLLPKLREGCEIILSPEAYNQNMIIIPKSRHYLAPEEIPEVISDLRKSDGLAFEIKLPPLKRSLIEKLANENKLKIIETKKPMILANGITTSGEIELSDADETTKGFYIMEGRKEYKKNTFRDEISIYLNIKNKGLVVVTGCGHAGVVNTIKHAQKLTGIDKIYALIGGFHKEWESIEEIEKAVKFIENLNPFITCGMHCTGFEFNKLMSRHPSHTFGIAGTEFHF